MALSREQILSNKAKRVEKIAVPEWGGDVFIREISAAERDAFELEMAKGKGSTVKPNFRGSLAALVLCDESGTRLFSNTDASQLGQMPSSGVDRVFAAASKLNAFSKEDVDELEKNSESDQPGE